MLKKLTLQLSSVCEQALGSAKIRVYKNQYFNIKAIKMIQKIACDKLSNMRRSHGEDIFSPIYIALGRPHL